MSRYEMAGDGTARPDPRPDSYRAGKLCRNGLGDGLGTTCDEKGVSNIVAIDGRSGREVVISEFASRRGSVVGFGPVVVRTWR